MVALDEPLEEYDTNHLIQFHQISNSDIDHTIMSSDRRLLKELLSSDQTVSFHPIFTYVFYGNDQLIKASSGLQIHILISCLSFKICIILTKNRVLCHDHNLFHTLILPIKEYFSLDEIYFNTLTSFLNAINEINIEEVRPLGSFLPFYSYAKSDDDDDDNGNDSNLSMKSINYHVYHMKLNEKHHQDLVESLQFFVPFYIEGGVKIDTKDPKWHIYTLYKVLTVKGEAHFQLVGYVTLYAFLYYPDRIRMRLSQFLILPPYQRKGHGRNLYNAVMAEMRLNKQVVEVPVEEPNEQFTRLRDVCDLEILLKDPHMMEYCQTGENLKQLVAILSKKYKLVNAQVIKMCHLIKKNDLFPLALNDPTVNSKKRLK